MQIDWQAGFHSLATYPAWLVIVCSVLAAAFTIWLLAKLVKWTVAIIAALVILACGAALVWWLLGG
ncbi:MAG: hypothetical protein KGJ37_06395 [Verrucomicrobiota bacterium]|nr:hypothetical protein [Verrucomicrobiota bacterium]